MVTVTVDEMLEVAVLVCVTVLVVVVVEVGVARVVTVGVIPAQEHAELKRTEPEQDE